MAKKRKHEIRKQKWRSALAVLLLSLPILLLAGMDFGLFAIEIGDRPVREDKEGRLQASNKQLKEAFETVTKNVFYDGVYVDDIALGGMTRDEGIAAVQAKAMDFLSQIRFELEARDEIIEVSGNDLGAEYNISDAINEAWSKGRVAVDSDIEQQVLRRYQEIERLRQSPFRGEGEFDYNRDYMRDAITAKLSAITVAPVKAKATAFDPSNGRFTISEKVDGISANIEKAVEDVMGLLDEGTYKGRIKVEMEDIDAGMSASEMAANLGFRAEGSTPINLQDAGRQQNLRRAAQLINGTVINPGETYSYMNSLGPITTANGYHAASILSDGQYEDALGGGLCQPSTTIFQAVFKADLEVVERHNHGRRSDYYQFGMDAMVYGTSADFKFRNNTDYPIGLVAIWQQNKMTFRVYGQPLLSGVTIGMASEKIETIPAPPPERRLNNDLAPGEERVVRNAVEGSVWRTYKVYYQNGNETRRELTNTSRYRAFAQLTEHGPHPTPAPTPPPPPATPATPAPTPVVETPPEVPDPVDTP